MDVVDPTHVTTAYLPNLIGTQAERRVPSPAAGLVHIADVLRLVTEVEVPEVDATLFATVTRVQDLHNPRVAECNDPSGS
jgi:hypothetical protein